MSDTPPPHETRGSPAHAGGRTPTRWWALVALSSLVAASLFPYVFGKHIGTPRTAHTEPRTEVGVEEAGAAVASLSSALGALGRVGARIRADESDPPDPSAFPSTTACVRSYLPDIDIAEGSVDLLCSEVDLWTTEWTLDVRLAHRQGGAQHWTRLGHHSLAAIAAMRAGCCVAPVPLSAVVPGLWCGVLRDTLSTIGPAPTLREIADYEAMMRCLSARAVHLPARWEQTSPDASDAAFGDFLRTARRRRKD